MPRMQRARCATHSPAASTPEPGHEPSMCGRYTARSASVYRKRRQRALIPATCATHGARTQQRTAWKVHGVAVHHVWGLPATGPPPSEGGSSGRARSKRAAASDGSTSHSPVRQVRQGEGWGWQTTPLARDKTYTARRLSSAPTRRCTVWRVHCEWGLALACADARRSGTRERVVGREAHVLRHTRDLHAPVEVARCMCMCMWPRACGRAGGHACL